MVEFMERSPFSILNAVVLSILIAFSYCTINDNEDFLDEVHLKLEPTDIIVRSGTNATFTCSSPVNRTLSWHLKETIHPYRTFRGTSFDNATNTIYFWTKLEIASVKRTMSSEITCVADEDQMVAVGFLVVNGVHIGGNCIDSEDCVTEKAICRNSMCECPRDEVLLRLTKNGYEVCRKMIYRLYDPCDFSEQCFHLVDSKSVCASSGICVCAGWAMDVNGKCVSKGEASHNKNQELYRVGLVAITCLVILIIMLSLWMTLKKSCYDGRLSSFRSHTSHSASMSRANDAIMEMSEDKPPSYDDVLEVGDTVAASPPNFMDALKNSMSAKKLLRQVSAPAGQLLSRTASLSMHVMKKSGAKNSATGS